MIQKVNPVIQKENSCAGSEEYYPKCLIIAFKSKIGNFNLSLKTDKIFGKCNWGLQGGDPFSDLGKRKSTLKIEFFTGGTLRISPVYYFKFRNNKWQLIGYTETQIEVPSNDTYIEDYNLVKGIKESYSVINNKRKAVKTVTFSISPLKDLQDFDATGGGIDGITD